MNINKNIRTRTMKSKSQKISFYKKGDFFECLFHASPPEIKTNGGMKSNEMSKWHAES